jgi:hypothetical protein
MGRKKKSGPRSEKTGRLLQVRDYGNDRVQRRVDCFRHFRGDSSTGFEMTCAGRLMLVGCFDGMDDPAETVLSTLLAYSDGYWGNFGGGAKVAQYERSDRSQDNSTYQTEDLRGEWFNAMDKRLRDAGHEVRRAVHQVSVDRHWFPDADAFWAAAIINRRILDKRDEYRRAGKAVPPELSIVGEVAFDGHSAWDNLELLRLGASALIGNFRANRSLAA